MICWQNVTGPGSRTRDINYPLTTLTLLLSPRSDIGDNVSEESGVMLISLMWWTSSSICSNQSEYSLLSNSKALAPLVFFSPLRSSIVKSIFWLEMRRKLILPTSYLARLSSCQPHLNNSAGKIGQKLDVKCRLGTKNWPEFGSVESYHSKLWQISWVWQVFNNFNVGKTVGNADSWGKSTLHFLLN